MKRVSAILILLAAVLPLACSYEEMFERIVPKEEAAFAQEYLNHLRVRDFEFVLKHLHPEVRDEISEEKLLEIAAYFRDGEPVSVEVIGSQTQKFNSNWRGNFTFEYQFQTGWNVANVVLARTEGKNGVLGFHVYRTEASQREINALSLTGKSIGQVVFLLAAVAVPIFIVVTLIFCFRTPVPKRKWLWVLFIMVGIGVIGVNWTTGQFNVRVASLNLLGAGAFAGGPHAPWFITVGFPLGAIMFWIRRRGFLKLASAKHQTELCKESSPETSSDLAATTEQEGPQ